MKGYASIRFRKGLSLVVVILLMGLTPLPLERRTDIASYKGDHFSLRYPSAWVPFQKVWPEYQYQHDPYLDADEVWGVADLSSKTPWEKFTTSARVLRKKAGTASLQEAFRQAYKNMPPPVEWLSEREIRAQGTLQIEKTYKRPLRRAVVPNA